MHHAPSHTHTHAYTHSHALTGTSPWTEADLASGNHTIAVYPVAPDSVDGEEVECYIIKSAELSKLVYPELQ